MMKLTVFGLLIEISNRPGRYSDCIVPSTGATSVDVDTSEPPLIDKNHDGISLLDLVCTVGDFIQPCVVVVRWCRCDGNVGNKCRHETTVRVHDSIVAVFA